VTDFRSEHSPKKGPLGGLILKGWAANTYLGCWQFSPLAELQMAKVSPFKFLQEVRDEMKKVTWPTRRETGITTLMVFIMSAAAAVFFLIADQLIRLAVTTVLGIL